jgi:hypothetical protein
MKVTTRGKVSTIHSVKSNRELEGPIARAQEKASTHEGDVFCVVSRYAARNHGCA